MKPEQRRQKRRAKALEVIAKNSRYTGTKQSFGTGAGAARGPHKVSHRLREAAPTAQRVRFLLHYNPETGVFTRRVPVRAQPKAQAGDVAGYRNPQGYIKIRIDGIQFMASRLAWLYQTGTWPLAIVDHRDGNRSNDAWDNLRLATRTQNNCNRGKQRVNTSGFKGVCPHGSKFQVRIIIARQSG